MSEVSPFVEGFRVTIKAILNTSDLSTISAKGVRKQLIAAGADPNKVKEHRKEFDELIKEAFDQLPPPPSAPTSAQPSASPSPSISQPPASSQPTPLSRRKPKATVKADVKPRVSSATPKKRKSAATIVDSDASGSELGASASGSESGRGKKKRKSGGGGGGGAFNKEMGLSPALAALVASGSPPDDPQPQQCSRPQTVKRIWVHIKANDLQDPADKRYINCDDLMYAVFKTRHLHMFTMNKLLSGHLRPLEA